MKRNSILYDYKPRLEWTDPTAARRRNRTRKLLLSTILLIAVGGIFLGYKQFNTESSEKITAQAHNQTGQLTKITRNLDLPPLIEDKIDLSVTTKSSPAQNQALSTVSTTPVSKPAKHEKPEIVKDRQKDEYTPSEDLSQAPTSKEIWKTVTVKDGDNLSLIFSRLSISKNDLYQILSLGEETQSLKRLKPGQVLRLKFDDSRVEELVHEPDLTHTLKVKKTADEFEAKLIEEKPEKKIATANGTIQDSLFLSGQKAGLSDNIIMQMFDIFGWDIDFVLDIREGDEFRVIYEELYKKGEKIKDGKILAAEFINQGKIFKAVRYVDSDNQPGYYSEKGQSMKKAFLRTPVNFTRISSYFNLKRKHPILNKIRAHKGVDYAAPIGTPVKATGNGKVVFAGKKNGYGNTVIIQHGGKYSTLYAHLSRFARGLKKGKRVEQGRTIAYVGKTGLATGPHLHYEFRVNGVHRNPLTVDLPKSLPLPEKYMNDFIHKTRPLLTQLATLSDDQRHANSGKPEIHKPVKINIATREEYPAQTNLY